jgi:hypothetical protein
MSDEGESRAESILRSDAANGNMQRMICKENLRATENGLEARATPGEAGTLLAEVSTQLGLMLCPGG